ncbi:MAG: glycosyltransferase family 2 protein [Actinomycetota bacterium]
MPSVAVPRWVGIAVDYFAASAGLLAITLLGGGSLSPTALLAPMLLVYFNWAIGLYGPSLAGRQTTGRPRTPLALLLTTGIFAWCAGVIESSSIGGGSLGAVDQLVLWGGVFASGLANRSTAAGAVKRADPERWLVVGGIGGIERLEYALRGDRDQNLARIVAAQPIPSNGTVPLERRSEAMAAVESSDVDRVVLALGAVDSGTALELVHTFKALGVPVSLLEPPPDLTEGLPLAERRVGQLPVVDVGQLTRNGHASQNGHAATNGNAAMNGHAATNGHTATNWHAARNGWRPRVSVIIPALNEEENLPHVLERLPARLHEVILVDGSSNDQTVEVAIRERPGIRVLAQSGRGKGDALQTGFAAVTGDVIVTLDADGSADPAEIPRFVETLMAGSDFAKGSRFVGDGGSDDITAIRQLGNWALNTTANALYGTRHSDLCYGYNAFWTRCLPYISLDVTGFEVETLMTLRSAKAGLKVSEVPSYEAKRLHGKSNLKIWRDGFRVLRTIIRERQA